MRKIASICPSIVGALKPKENVTQSTTNYNAKQGLGVHK
jgi:hypothetical protein